MWIKFYQTRMKINKMLWPGAAALLLASAGSVTNTLCAQEVPPPNIVVILTDDQGYADISFNPEHPPEVHTPNMDALASEGIFFSQAYITGNVCSPTRAGLMTGRYQQRAGIYTAGEGGSGLPLDLTIFPEYLKQKGYVSKAFGKWHLGLTLEYNPVSRGFDEFFGFMGRGAHDYYNLDDDEEPLYDGLETTTAQGYLTNLLTDSAVNFIRRHTDEPFFCYLAYNAVHTPMQAPAEDIADFNTGDETRDILMAMLRNLDNGVGAVVNALKEEGIWDNTLLFFLTDNGGAGATHANNSPLRGFKQQNWEGGIRTPFVMSWPDRFSGGRTISTPVISLDILPTVLDALDIEEPTDRPLDGKSILPVIANEDTAHHDYMFWTEGGGEGEWAVRYKNWKLVVEKDEFHLSDLDTDRSEGSNLIDAYPDTADLMIEEFLSWLDEMAEPVQEPSKAWIPKIEAGQLASLYDRLYFRGNVQHLDSPGEYLSSDLGTVGDDKTKSVLVADGYRLKAYSDNGIAGSELVIYDYMPFLEGPGDGLSSLLLLPAKVVIDLNEITITASIEEQTAENTVDGDYGTWWEAIGEGEWIQFEFSYVMKIDGVNLAFKKGGDRKTYFDILVSEDGENWTKVIENGEGSGESTSLESFTFPAVNAKYVRIVGYGNSDNRQNHYTEITFSIVEVVLDGYVIEAEDYINATGMDEIYVDDFAGLKGITNSNMDAEVVYTIDDLEEGNYLVKIRSKPKKAGSIEIKISDISQGVMNVTGDMIVDRWTDLEKVIAVPPGDKTMTVDYSTSSGSNSMEFNWFQLFPTDQEVGYAFVQTDDLTVYPNPCSELLYIQSDAPVCVLDVFDQWGRNVLNTTDLAPHTSLSVAHLSEGLYLARLHTDRASGHIKFIVSR
jgi:arylsulfatase A-like enzyme